MNLLRDFAANRVLLCSVAAWFAAQLIKIIIKAVIEKKLDLSLIMSSGGMPSSHSATVCALCVAVAKLFTLSSPEFAIASIFSFIVMYDAAGVRQSVGKQAAVLNRIFEQQQNQKFLKVEFSELKELVGHTPMEVICGALLGIVMSSMVL